jgi:SAM-dependent methyltransferase
MDDKVRRYYGEVLRTSADLRTSACCTEAALPDHVKAVLGRVHDEVSARYFGCGLVLPDALEGARVLDLGCGAGRDCYVISALVGEGGSVVGVDMTPEQLAVARRHREYHARAFGQGGSNVEFLDGNIERLGDIGLANADFDVIVSNCVINLVEDKAAVLREAYRLLREGGELYFADIYADRRVPVRLRSDPVLHGECLAGALYWNDFITLAKACGFRDPRLVADRPVTVDDPALATQLGNLRFFSATWRLWKLPGLEPACEDYGQAVRYRGSVPHCADRLQLDKHHVFQTGKLVLVCGNTWRMLRESRFSAHFEFLDGPGMHFGIFPGCGLALPFSGPVNEPTSGVSCC